jgi:hypothetical protein
MKDRLVLSPFPVVSDVESGIKHHKPNREPVKSKGLKII